MSNDTTQPVAWMVCYANGDPRFATMNMREADRAMLFDGCRVRPLGYLDATPSPSVAALEEKEAAVVKVLEGFDRGVFVRDNSGDVNPAWAIKLLPYLRALAVLEEWRAALRGTGGGAS